MTSPRGRDLCTCGHTRREHRQHVEHRQHGILYSDSSKCLVQTSDHHSLGRWCQCQRFSSAAAPAPTVPFKPLLLHGDDGDIIVAWGPGANCITTYGDIESAAADFGERYAAWKAGQR